MSTPLSLGLRRTVERETRLLAPYAMHTVDSAGRKHAEQEHPYRALYQRDRDRILHSSAFRRLSGKTQVFAGDMGDYHRTRLTHTFEVASIARTISRVLRLNEDLVEALALFHDVGHPPFGHAGEAALNDCLARFGGFSHNQHALTIAEELEQTYHQFHGLNLTREVLDSQIARVRNGKSAADPSPLLEAQVVDVADSITYDAHDTDDAVKLGLLTIQQLAEIPLIAKMLQRIRERFPGVGDNDVTRKALVHELIDFQVSDVLNTIEEPLAHAGFDSAQAARNSQFRILPSAELMEQKRALEAYLYANVYRHPRLLEVRAHAQQRLREMYEYLSQDPELLPGQFQRRGRDVGWERAAGEYLAGMTDRYFEQQFAQMVGRRFGG